MFQRIMALTNEEIAAKFDDMKKELEYLKNRTRSRSRSKDARARNNSGGGGTSAGSEDSLTAILKNYSDALKGLSQKVLSSEDSDPTLTGVINSLSKSRVSRAVSDFSQQGTHKNTNFGITTTSVKVPVLVPEDKKAESKVLRENLASLKDLFKSALTGAQGEDFASYLQTASELSEASKLSLSQFYLLLRSRISPHTGLYVDITHHNNSKTPIQDLFNEIIPLYGEKSNYLLNLQKYENFVIPPNTPPIEVLGKIKSLVTDLAYSSGTQDDKRDFIFQRVREKALSLYPTIAPFLIREETPQDNNLGGFTRLFNRLSPMTVDKRKKVNEVKIEPCDTVYEIAEAQPSRTIKLTKQHLNRLKDKCFKVKKDDYFS